MKKSILTIALLLLPGITLAQSAQTFSAQPTYPNKVLPYQFSIEAKPDSSDTENLTINNLSNTPVVFNLHGVDSSKNEKGETIFKLATDKQENVGLWISTPQDSVTVPANAKAQVDFQINIPADAAKQDYLGGISVEAENVGTIEKDGQTLQVNIRNVVRTNIRVTNTPQPIEKLPAPPLFSNQQIYLGLSILLVIVACGYFGINSIRSKSKKHHKA